MMKLQQPPSPGQEPLSHKSSLLACVLALVVVLGVQLAFLPLYSTNSFVGDDYPNIVQNERMHPVTSERVREYWTAPFINLYIPMIYTVWSGLAVTARDDAAPPLNGGFDARYFHILNIILHTCNALLIYMTLLLLVQRPNAAFFGAAVYAMHPVMCESVAWVTELKSVLSGFFAFTSLLLFLLSMQKQRLRKVYYALALFAYALALLSKPLAVVIPTFMVVLSLMLQQRSLKKSVLACLPFFALALGVVFVTIAAQPPSQLQEVTTPWLRPLAALDAGAFYLGKLLWPVDFVFDYGRTPAYIFKHWWGYVTWVFPILVVGLCWRFRKIRPEYLAGALIFFLGYAPVSGLTPFRFQEISTVADRYVYYSMFGAALAVGAFYSRLQKRFLVVAWVFGGALLCWLVVQTHAQATLWGGEKSLMEHNMALTPHSFTAPNYLARAAYHGEPRSIALYQTSLQRRPDYTEALVNLAMATLLLTADPQTTDYSLFQKPDADTAPLLDEALSHLQQGRPEEALAPLGRAVVQEGISPQINNRIGAAFCAMGQSEQAGAHFELALRFAAHDAGVRSNLAVALFRMGRRHEALALLQQALSMAPGNTHIQENYRKIFNSQNGERPELAILMFTHPQ